MLTTKTFVEQLQKLGSPDTDKKTIKKAKDVYSSFRAQEGFSKSAPSLLTPPGNNIKMSKGEVANYGLSLAPARISGEINVCSHSTPGCRDLCINTAGNGLYPIVQTSRIAKTKFAVKHPLAFLTLLKSEISKAYETEDKLGIRLNVFSDIPWEEAAPWLFSDFPDVQFYDYTKNPTRFENALPSNYHLTLSASERMSDKDIDSALKSGISVAIVADKLEGEVPTKWLDNDVLDGDITDYRPSDPAGTVVFLKPKGKARKAERGKFVRTTRGFA